MDIRLLKRAELVIVDEMIVKNRMGPSNRKAEAGDFERADVIVKNGKVVRNWCKW